MKERIPPPPFRVILAGLLGIGAGSLGTIAVQEITHNQPEKVSSAFTNLNPKELRGELKGTIPEFAEIFDDLCDAYTCRHFYRLQYPEIWMDVWNFLINSTLFQA